MTEIGRAGVSTGAGYASAIGTGPTKVEKKVVDSIVDTAKEIGTNIKDSIKNVVKTPEGKAIVAGLALSPILPVIGPAIALGGAAAAALKFLKNAFQSAKTPENKVDTGSVLNNVKKAAIIVAGATVGAVGGLPGIIAAGTLTKIALDSVEKTQKGSSYNESEMQWAQDFQSKVKKGDTVTPKEMEKYEQIYNKYNKESSSVKTKESTINSGSVTPEEKQWAKALQSKISNEKYKPTSQELKVYSEIIKNLQE